MTEQSKKVLAEALELPPIERATLVEKLLSSFDFPARKEVDPLWAKEVEERIDAYERGELHASPIEDVFNRLNRQHNTIMHLRRHPDTWKSRLSLSEQ